MGGWGYLWMFVPLWAMVDGWDSIILQKGVERKDGRQRENGRARRTVRCERELAVARAHLLAARGGKMCPGGQGIHGAIWGETPGDARRRGQCRRVTRRRDMADDGGGQAPLGV